MEHEPETQREHEVENEIFPMSVEQLEETIEKLEDQYRILAGDPNFKEDAEQISKIIMNLEARIQTLQN